MKLRKEIVVLIEAIRSLLSDNGFDANKNDYRKTLFEVMDDIENECNNTLDIELRLRSCLTVVLKIRSDKRIAQQKANERPIFAQLCSVATA